MKKLLFLAIAFILSFAVTPNTAKASNAYTVNDEAVETLFQSGVQVLSLADESATMLDIAGVSNAETVKASGKNPLVAFLLSWFLGYLGIHRAYLGTATGVVIGYILTCGGLGIVATIDWIVLLIGVIDDDISKYENNKKFFMW
ncbi:TM2 domain-containing protein [Flexibacter flexilis DSM 6793]|uniref:TM2 domain-containing protein n=1 Tax=Flexibacter flexilis DSM 6793 TaxID=927664 RepID=A0A1I1MBN9_9BACT|nr:TM2 domain-containing protein [Flexibacter flexilis]SFC82506.1 TM2 domain-containing protein [Flexibacter flexilis DSM 6793]